MLLFRIVLLSIVVLAMGHASAADLPQVKVETSAGDFVLELDDSRAPLSVANFLQYVADDFYAGTVFHRVVNGFVIQGGGYTPDLKPKPPKPGVPNESGNGLSNRRGTVGMARTGEPHSADAQFYINLADNLELDPKPTRWGYAVFGQVIEGLDIVDEIGHRSTGNRDGMQGVPIEPVVIRRVSVLKTRIAR